MPSGRRRLGATVGIGVLALVLLGSSLATGAPGRDSASSLVNVVTVTQSPNPITQQDALTVALQAANPSVVKFMYFTFCELQPPNLCFNPIVMTSQGSGWFQGSTQRMFAYHGMIVGMTAGYNITIEDTNNVNVTLPNVAGQFHLNTTLSVAGFLEFKVAVSDHTYRLSGRVLDATTHAAIAGATVTLSAPNATAVPTSSSGDYTFSGVANGTYQLSVRKAGYHTSNSSVQFQGANLTQDVSLANASAPNGSPSGGGGTQPGFLETTAGRATVAGAAAAVVVVGIVVVLVRRSRTGGPPAAGGPGPDPPRAPSPKS